MNRYYYVQCRIDQTCNWRHYHGWETLDKALETFKFLLAGTKRDIRITTGEGTILAECLRSGERLVRQGG